MWRTNRAVGLRSLLVLLVAVVQVPPLLISGPIIIYMFSTASTTTAVVFMIWGIFLGISDTFLKPLLLGHGVQVHLLVVLIGAIGGMILSGIIDLFLGAVILALGYQLFTAWLKQSSQPMEQQGEWRRTSRRCIPFRSIGNERSIIRYRLGT